MSRTYLLTPSASNDLDEILSYILERSGPDQALHVHRHFFEAFMKLSEAPGLGHVRDDLADESLRVWAVFSFLIIYRRDVEPLQIVRIIHGARDLANVLAKDT